MKQILTRYLKVFPGEHERLRRLQEFLRDTTDPKQWFLRKNFNGHITASGFVLSPDRKKLALVKHKYLDRYLQPGGHVEEGDENILAAARREIVEETGLQNFRHEPFRGEPLLPIDIDTHAIPANPKKNEAAHWHHDFRYLFIAESEINPLTGETSGDHEWLWRPIENAIDDETFKLVFAKLIRREPKNSR